MRSEPVMTNDKIIEIDQITSGKNNIFTFLRNGTPIDFPPFTLHPPTSEYTHEHNFNKSDLAHLNITYPSIYPNETNENINDWRYKVQSAFIKLIQGGEFNKTYTHNGQKVNIKCVWRGL